MKILAERQTCKVSKPLELNSLPRKRNRVGEGKKIAGLPSRASSTELKTLFLGYKGVRERERGGFGVEEE